MSSEFYKNKKRESDLTVGSDVLQGLFENGKSPLSEQFIRWKLWGSWAQYVGATIAKNCEPVGYYRGTLYVWVKSSSWMQQLIFGLEQMKSQINSKLGFQYVITIHLTMDKKSVPRDAQASEQLKQNINYIQNKE